MSAELAIRQQFYDGTPLPYKPPQSTLDDRFPRCRVHRLGCDCWEGLRNEDLGELRGELRLWTDAAAKILAGHPVTLWTADGMTQVGCQCTGCQIARAAYWSGRYMGESVQLHGTLA